MSEKCAALGRGSKLRTVTDTTPPNAVTVSVAVIVAIELVGRRHRQASMIPSSPYFLRSTGRQALACLRKIPTVSSGGVDVGNGVGLAEFGHVYWKLVLQVVSESSASQADDGLPENASGDHSSKAARGSACHSDGAGVGAGHVRTQMITQIQWSAYVVVTVVVDLLETRVTVEEKEVPTVVVLVVVLGTCLDHRELREHRIDRWATDTVSYTMAVDVKLLQTLVIAALPPPEMQTDRAEAGTSVEQDGASVVDACLASRDG